MHRYVAIACALLLTACQSSGNVSGELAEVSRSLERPIRSQEAREIALKALDRDIEECVQSDPAAWDALNRIRQNIAARLEAFLSRFRAGDELWTYSTLTIPCQERGFALVRHGRAADYMLLTTAYVGR